MKTASKVTPIKSMTTGMYVANRLLKLRNRVKVFSQGTRADAIFFVQTGRVEVTVISAYGKEAVLRVLGPHDFLGEECLAGVSLRTSTATTLEPSTLLRIEKRDMLEALHIQPAFSYRFVIALIARTGDLKQSLCDQLFNHIETRLARVLLRLAQSSNQHRRLSNTENLKVTHAILAEMVGANRSRITLLMNKFRRMGVIDYKGSGEITVMTELLTDVVLASR